MKKIFSTLAVAAVALTAAAQAPTTFNYQGKTTQVDADGKIAAITFAIVDGNGEGKDVYTQDMTDVQTVDNTFNVVIGGEEGWNDINWSVGGLVLVTRIAGVDVAVCPLQAVPYAINWTGEAAMWDALTNPEDGILTSIANEAGKTQTDLDTLTDALLNEEDGMLTIIQNQAAETQELVELLYSEEDGPIAALNQGLTTLSNKVDGFEQEIQNIYTDLNVAQEDIMNLTLANAARATETADLRIDVNSIGENANKAGEVAYAVAEDLEDNVKPALDELDTFTDDFYREYGEAMSELREELVGIEQNFELLYSEDDGPIASVTTGLTQLSNVVTDLAEQVETNTNGLAETQKDVMELVGANMDRKSETAALQKAVDALDQWSDEMQRDYADAMSELREELVGIEKNFELLYSEDDGPIAAVTMGLTQLSNVVSDQANDITALQEGLGVVENDLAEIVLANRETKTDLAQLMIDVPNIAENANNAGQYAVTALEMLNDQIVPDVDALKAGLDVVENDLAEIVKANREHATDIAEIKEAVTAIDLFTDELNRDYAASMSELREELVGIEKHMITDEMLDTFMANVEENVAKVNEIIDNLLAQKDENTDAIAYLSNDVQGLQEKMRGLATVDALNEVEATLMNVAENANLAAQTAQAAYDKASDFEDAINYISSDLQGVQELLRGKADIDDYTSMKNAIDELRRQIANNAAAIAGLTSLINR